MSTSRGNGRPGERRDLIALYADRVADVGADIRPSILQRRETPPVTLASVIVSRGQGRRLDVGHIHSIGRGTREHRVAVRQARRAGPRQASLSARVSLTAAVPSGRSRAVVMIWPRGRRRLLTAGVVGLLVLAGAAGGGLA